jgi:hypothetical protein
VIASPTPSQDSTSLVLVIQCWDVPRPRTTRTRYRSETGRLCIDLNIRQSRQLFDGRGPAPFKERDFDHDVVAYLLGAAQEIPRTQPLAIVVTISEEPQPRLAPDVIVEAVRGIRRKDSGQFSRVRRRFVLASWPGSRRRHWPCQLRRDARARSEHRRERDR